MPKAFLGEDTFVESTETSVVDGAHLRSLRGEAGVLADSPGAVVHSRPDTVSGTLVFVGTRVPVDNLFDDLEAGSGLAEFLDDFPSVTPIQALAALKRAREAPKRRAGAGAAR